MTSVDADALRRGFAELDQLAREDYHGSLEDVLREPDEIAERRLGRLIGVSLKQPFAEPVVRPARSTFSGSYRDWVVRPALVVTADVRGTWQHRTLEVLSDEMNMGGVESVVTYARNETGFFGCLADSVRGYVCGDPTIRERVEKDVAAARSRGLQITEITPEIVVTSGGVALGTYLVANVAVLGFVGVPVIAGFVLLLYRIGVDAFCRASRPSDDQAG